MDCKRKCTVMQIQRLLCPDKWNTLDYKHIYMCIWISFFGPTSGIFFRGDLVMKKKSTAIPPLPRKKSSCQLLAKECALSIGKLPRRLAQEQCG